MPARLHYIFVLFMGNDLDDIRARHGRPSGSYDLLWRANTAVTHHPLLKTLFVLQFLRRPALAALQRSRGGYRQHVFRAMGTDIGYLEDSPVYLRVGHSDPPDARSLPDPLLRAGIRA